VTARWTRVEDTIALAKIMGWRRIGIATCIGMLAETDELTKILAAQGPEPLSVCCKTGSIDKLRLGLAEKEKIRPGTFDPACNPIAVLYGQNFYYKRLQKVPLVIPEG